MILVDTSAWIDFFSRKSSVSNKVDELLEENQVAICGPVITELLRGFASEKEKRRILTLLEGCRLLPQPSNLWTDAGEIGFQLNEKRKKLKTFDLLICCYALAYQIPLLTLDSDFKKIQEAGIPLFLAD